MRHELFVLALALVPAAFAQNPAPGPPATPQQETPGPAILTGPMPQAGERSGQQLDLRFYGGVSGVFDNGEQPLVTDAQGNLVRTGDLFGTEITLGAYGGHSWRHSRLGLQYNGVYRHYGQNTAFDGSDQIFVLRYAYQKSQRLTFDFSPSAGSYTRLFGDTQLIASDAGVNPTTQFFDSRTDFVQGTVSMTYQQSPRTTYVVTANAYFSGRHANALADANGFGFSGQYQRRLSRTTSVGVVYSYVKQQVPAFFSNSDVHSFQGTFDKLLGQHWTLSLQAGALITEVNSTQPIALDPFIAALYGLPTIVNLKIYSRDLYPSGSARLRKEFSHAAVSLTYSRATTAGNGFFLTSRAEDANLGFSYSGIRKWNLGVNGGWGSLHPLGQNFGQYESFQGGLGFTYELFRATHLTGRYDFRDQLLDIAGYRHTASRATIGLVFSPGTLPLSLF